VLIRLVFILLLAGAIFGGAYLAVHELYLKPKLELQADKEAPRPAAPPDPSLRDFKQCEEIKATGTRQEAMAAFERFLKMHPGSPKREEARDILGELNSAQFFSVQPTDANTVIVKPGDSLGRISAHAKMSTELIVHLNKLENDKIHPGQKLIAFPTNFRLVLNQRQQRVILMDGEKYFRQYPTLSWPGKKPPVFLPKQTARVLEKIALNDKDQPPKASSKEYFPCFHSIGYPISGHSIYSRSDTSVRQTTGGIRLAQDHMSEIAVLLPKGAQVTLE
jgi:LysM repeat protein